MLTGLIVVPVASPPSLICSRKGLEKGSVALASAATRRRQHVADQFDALASQLGAYAGDAGDVSARPRKARDQPRADRITRVGHHDGDFVRRLLCRLCGGREPGHDDIDLETDQLGSQFGKPIGLSLCRSKLEPNVLSLDISQLAQSLPKVPPKLFRIGTAEDQCADGRQFCRLLRAPRERPHGWCSAEERDELAPPCMSQKEHCEG